MEGRYFCKIIVDCISFHQYNIINYYAKVWEGGISMKNLNVSMPLYYQIVSDIKAKIEEGILAPGDKLPTENSLSKT